MTPQEEKIFLQWQGDCLRAETSLEALDRELQMVRAQVADAIGAVNKMHDHCVKKHDAIEAGVEKSKMGAKHYLDQAIGLSHAIDILHNLKLRIEPPHANQQLTTTETDK